MPRGDNSNIPTSKNDTRIGARRARVSKDGIYDKDLVRPHIRDTTL
jgi:hypothetical protein